MTRVTEDARPPDRTVRYGDHPDQVVDIWLPPSGAPEPGPMVVFVHGGFWRAAYDRTHAVPLVADLAARGFPVALVEYRRVGQDGGGWPGTFDDVALGVGAVAGDAGDAGPVLAGHSAGGHLALWYAARWPERVRGVVALAPVADLVLGHRLGVGNGAIADLLGGDPSGNRDRYTAADPAADPAAAPGRRPPVRLLHGREDDVVPIVLSRSYAERTGAELVELPDAGHFDVIEPASAAWPSVVDAFDAFRKTR